MSIESKLFDFLKTRDEITSIIGAGDNCKIYPVIVPQQIELPYLRIQKISNERIYSHNGYAGLQRARIQIDCFAKQYSEVKDLSEKVILALEVFSKVENIKGSFHANDLELWDEKAKVFHIPIDFWIWIN